MAVVFALVIVAAALAALVAAWQWQRRTRKASHGRAHDALASALAAVTEAEEPEGWVCPYCHADVLVDTDTCWLCGHQRPTEPSPPPPMTICGCGEPNFRDARSCIRCGKPLRPVF